MRNLRNKVQLIGNAGSTPVVQETKNGNKYAKLSLATNNWDADAMEAQAFAYLAAKSIKSLPYTFNKITVTTTLFINYPMNYPFTLPKIELINPDIL